jgi:uncharacterized membrane protein YphA (DoxX/SURF4 family)
MTTPAKVLISRKLDKRVGKTVSALLRFALGAGLISAVADRLGLRGRAPGSSSVTWRNMANFETYTKKLAPWCPGVILPTLAWGVTIAELVLGLLLIVGLWRKPTAVLAALLTLSFALSMTVVLGPHEPLNYSVFVFAFASLYLGLSQDVE